MKRYFRVRKGTVGRSGTLTRLRKNNFLELQAYRAQAKIPTPTSETEIGEYKDGFGFTFTFNRKYIVPKVPNSCSFEICPTCFYLCFHRDVLLRDNPDPC